MSIRYFYALGDSTLDNLFWMLERGLSMDAAKKASVEGQLAARLNADEHQYEVVSCAYDGFTTTSLLEGDDIGWVIGNYPPYMREKVKGDTPFVRPLEELKEKISRHPESTHYVVLSVGGNDFRVNLLNPWRLIRDIPHVQQRYLQIVEKIKELGNKNVRPILMFQYRTDANDDPYKIYPLMGLIGGLVAAIHILSIALLIATPLLAIAGKIAALSVIPLSVIGITCLYFSHRAVPLSVTKDILSGKKIGMVFLDFLIEQFYQPMLEKAKKDKLPILDLSNTFDPYDDLYICGIEPSKKGGTLISEGLEHILRNHDFESSSRLYSKSKGDKEYQSVENNSPKDWKVSYIERTRT